MTLKKLELQGFKSFALQTTFEFPGRITAIVGPNGSGKSNIIDAFRWVLGEREAKQLRGENLSNLIFAGSPKRPAVGLAKVTLYFNNKSNLFPFDFEEVTLSRKIDRSGVSQFFCNDAEIRLKDLLPLLARAKLGARGLNMIGQNESDIFIRSNPEERRLMIEEILGFREFRIKRNQAVHQLEVSQVNMERVQAMLQELVPHLRILRRQKNRFERRQEIENDLRELENNYFAYRFKEINSALDVLDPQLESLTKALAAKDREIKALEEKLEKINTGVYDISLIKSLRDRMAPLLAKKSSLEQELTRLEVKRDFQSLDQKYSSQELTEFIESLGRDLEKALEFNTLAEIKRLIDHWLQKLRDLLGGKRNTDLTLREKEAKLKQEIADIETALQKLREEEEGLVLNQENINREFRERLQGLENQKNERRAIEQQWQTIKFEREKLLIKLEELEQNWQAIGRSANEFKDFAAPAEINQAEAEKRMLKLRGELAAIGEIDPALIKEANESEERYTLLSRELEDLEKAIKDLRILIRELDMKLNNDFKDALSSINDEFNKYFRLMFGGGRAKLKFETPKITPAPASAPISPEETTEEEQVQEEKETREKMPGIEIELSLPRKKITSLDMLSGGEKSLVSLAALFAIISVSPPPFLVLDEIDAALDEINARRFADLLREFSHRTQFIIVTHNRATMEAADVLYGVTMADDGVSKVLSLKLES